MSRTPHEGVYPIRCYSFMAAAMTECLKEMVEKGQVEPEKIPPGVYIDAKNFLALVVEGARYSCGETGGVQPVNLVAMLRAHSLAEAARGGGLSVLETMQEILNFWERLDAFLKSLEEPRELSKDEKETANNLQKIFSQLHQMGESEAYQKVMGGRCVKGNLGQGGWPSGSS